MPLNKRNTFSKRVNRESSIALISNTCVSTCAAPWTHSSSRVPNYFCARGTLVHFCTCALVLLESYCYTFFTTFLRSQWSKFGITEWAIRFQTLPSQSNLVTDTWTGGRCVNLLTNNCNDYSPLSSDESQPETYNMCGHISNPGIDRELDHVYKL